MGAKAEPVSNRYPTTCLALHQAQLYNAISLDRGLCCWVFVRIEGRPGPSVLSGSYDPLGSCADAMPPTGRRNATTHFAMRKASS